MPLMLPLEDYVAQVLAALTPLKPVEVPLARAHGLVLAEDVTAAVPVPPWTNSAMDGYALRAQDAASACPQAPVALPVAGDVPAGAEPAPLAPGTAQRIMTGAMLPPGADAVVKVEDTDQAPGPRPLPARIRILAAPTVGLNVRRRAEDVAIGDPVLGAGTVLGAAAVSALASVGRGTVRAIPRVRVAVVSTGAELIDAGSEPAAGTIPDSNGLLLAGLSREHGAEPVSVTRSGDTTAELTRVLTAAACHADLVVTSGGVSAGAFDPLKMLGAAPRRQDGPAAPTGPAAPGGGGGREAPHAGGPEESEEEEAGADLRLDFAKVAMQPGKPQGHGWVRDRAGRRVPLIALPGNPVSVLVSFTTIVAPALARLSGHDGTAVGRTRPGRVGTALPVRARAAVPWRTSPGRRQHIPVRLVPAPQDPGPGAGAQDASGELWVAPSHRLGSGSHLVASLPGAQALAVVDARVERVEVGDEVALVALSHPAAPGAALPLEEPVSQPSPPAPRAAAGRRPSLRPGAGGAPAPLGPGAAGDSVPPARKES